MHPRDLGLTNVKEGDFLTEKLKVTYYEPEDNARKADISKYTSMQARHKKFFKTKFAKWFMKREWGRKLMFFFFGKKKDKKIDWPSWVIKTDEERCQNCFSARKALNKKWIATEKIDGTSTTFTMRQAKPRKRKMLVCSRNIVYDTPKKEEKNFYKDTDGNVYLEMAAKYDIEKVLNYMLTTAPNLEYVTIQGETYGGTIQKRNYGPEHRLVIFNIIGKFKGEAPIRLNPIKMAECIKSLNEECGSNLESVPVLGYFELPETCDELLALTGGKSLIDGEPREGIVLRSEDGVDSFKAVDNNYLEKYHG